jgi:hypothetical protein
VQKNLNGRLDPYDTNQGSKPLSMTPMSFEFTLSMPSDARLIGAIRQLTAHAAGYAQLEKDAGEGLAGHVEQAAMTAIASAPSTANVIEFRFSRDESAVTVVITADAALDAPPPRSSSAEGVSIDWHANGSRHICRIRQRTS